MTLKALIAVTALACAAPANAATYLITFDGTVTRGFDLTGMFGTAGADLAGQTYRAVYTLTDPTPGAIVYADPVTAFIRGGSSTGTPSPVSAKITITGNTVSLPGQTDAAAQGEESPDALYYSARDNSFTGGFDTTNSINSFVIFGGDEIDGPDYRPLLAYDIMAGDQAGGSFEFLTFDNNIGEFSSATFGTLTASRITISLAAAVVPEPSAWALLIVGFGAIGGAMRGRRQALATIG